MCNIYNTLNLYMNIYNIGIHRYIHMFTKLILPRLYIYIYIMVTYTIRFGNIYDIYKPSGYIYILMRCILPKAWDVSSIWESGRCIL